MVMLRRAFLQAWRIRRQGPGVNLLRKSQASVTSMKNVRTMSSNWNHENRYHDPVVVDVTPREPLSPATYEAVCEETLESLCSALEELLETAASQPGVDVELSNGVLTVKLGEAGTYVINKQSPNQQIWLSSPVSGPKRYDFVDDGWVYRRDGLQLHELLSRELSQLLGTSVDLSLCSHTGS
ncbi:frataxin, mitochondrial-like isoform X3 [Amphibalanus amphitrite]|uniref:frataxin, mitochondrial-like isoform X3 n=1 Tax=Amphibalanus amphitrite TaxID=1232801 RepID=UPI001C8FDF6C|nr:frataxin, mitochondrial-like isoform X3 [Amphibalanus amphitrite]